MNKATNMIDS